MPPVASGSDATDVQLVGAIALDADIQTDRLGAEFGAPVLAKPRRWWDLIAEIRDTTDESPRSARTRTRLQRARRVALMRRAVTPICRRGHVLTAANVYVGKRGSQCRECRNASRRDHRQHHQQQRGVA